MSTLEKLYRQKHHEYRVRWGRLIETTVPLTGIEFQEKLLLELDMEDIEEMYPDLKLMK